MAHQALWGLQNMWGVLKNGLDRELTSSSFFRLDFDEWSLLLARRGVTLLARSCWRRRGFTEEPASGHLVPSLPLSALGGDPWSGSRTERRACAPVAPGSFPESSWATQEARHRTAPPSAAVPDQPRPNHVAGNAPDHEEEVRLQPQQCARADGTHFDGPCAPLT